MKKARSLKDIKVNEVSLVDKAANNKEFLFFKQDGKTEEAVKPKKLKKKINIVIDSDGTIGGTKIAVNKDALKGLRDFSFYFYGDEDDSRSIFCSYSKVVETEDGFSRSETFHLAKGDVSMHKDIQKKLEEYFGTDEEVDFEKACEDVDIVKALGTINEYRGEFPDDLKEAVGQIAKQAGLYTTKKVEKKTDEVNEAEPVEKAGAKLSKETMKKVTDALDALKSILPDLEKSKDSESATKKTEVEKMIGELQDAVAKIEKNKESTIKDEFIKVIKDLTTRISVVEKGTGLRKSIQDQDNDELDTEGKLWPSISG